MPCQVITYKSLIARSRDCHALHICESWMQESLEQIETHNRLDANAENDQRVTSIDTIHPHRSLSLIKEGETSANSCTTDVNPKSNQSFLFFFY